MKSQECKDNHKANTHKSNETFPFHYYGGQSKNRMRVLQTSWHFSCYQLVPNNCIRGKSMLLFSHFSVVHIHSSMVTHFYIHLSCYIANSFSSDIYISSSVSQWYVQHIGHLGQILYQHPLTWQLISSNNQDAQQICFISKLNLHLATKK